MITADIFCVIGFFAGFGLAGVIYRSPSQTKGILKVIEDDIDMTEKVYIFDRISRIVQGEDSKKTGR